MTDLNAVVFTGQDGESKTKDMEGQQTNQPGLRPVNLKKDYMINITCSS